MSILTCICTRNSITLLVIVFVIINTACDNLAYELSDKDLSTETINDDNLIFKENQELIYKISIQKEQINYGVDIDMINFGFNEALPLIKITDSVKFVKYFSITAEGASNEDQINDFQTNIIYNFYDNSNEWIPYSSRTGVVDNMYNIWLHPPRISYFKLLNLSAYPYVKLPFKLNNSWEYSIPINKHWGHKSLGSEWKKQNEIFNHHYTVTDSLVLKDLICYKIGAKTTSSLGTSFSTFFYNKKYGFIKMTFNKLDGTEITFDLEL